MVLYLYFYVRFRIRILDCVLIIHKIGQEINREGVIMPTLTKQDSGVFIIPFPVWAKLPRCQELFALSEVEIRKAADEGYVKRIARNSHVIYRCKDLDAYLEAKASGKQPRRAK